MDKVRIGVIGLGNMGSYHVQYANTLEGACLGAICDMDRPRLDKFARQHEVPAYSDFQEMYNSGNIDAVVIAVPHYFHGEMARAAFAKGIHVMSEKPAAVSVKDSRKTNEAYAKAPHLKFGIMFQSRTVPMYEKIRDLVVGGELGEITRISWIATDWFRTWTYYASGGWRATWAGEGGGVILNQCPHNLDLLWWLSGGMKPSRVTAVASIAKNHPIEVEDELSAIMEYPNGAIGHFITSTGEAPGSNHLEICGDRGKVTFQHGKVLFRRTRKSVREVCRTSPESFASVETWDMEVPYRTHPDGHKVVTQNFVNAILKDEPLISPGVDGVHGLEIGNAMLMAGITRTPVELPVDGDQYDQFIQEMIKKYGGKKQLAGQGDAKVDMNASFH